ncbi:hypothetical protein AVEN_188206-1 [Araneus ventricosus]|uniref:Uncharacterized protein n=1 Tax=Araneus ventricosus TaxID=182803 RepID=A0A4Y2KAI3_ARAVE|nr:hypothetical protein AVEN_188206-1 [Araneus ventricosus]
MVSSDGFLSNIESRDKPYSQSILEISDHFLPQNDRKSVLWGGLQPDSPLPPDSPLSHGKGLPREPLLLLGRSFGRSLRQYLVYPIVTETVPLAKIRELEVDSNDIDELVEEHSRELTAEELMELHCVSQQEVMEESLTEEENVTAKQQSSSAIKRNVEGMGNCCIVH